MRRYMVVTVSVIATMICADAVFCQTTNVLRENAETIVAAKSVWNPQNILAALICALGLLAILIYAATGFYLRRVQQDWSRSIEQILKNLHNVFNDPSGGRGLRLTLSSIMPTIKDGYSDYHQRFNEFWTTYGQVVIAILIITVISVLMLTKTVSAEAGLPILSAIASYAIAKNINAAAGIHFPSPPADEENERSSQDDPAKSPTKNPKKGQQGDSANGESASAPSP